MTTFTSHFTEGWETIHEEDGWAVFHDVKDTAQPYWLRHMVHDSRLALLSRGECWTCSEPAPKHLITMVGLLNL